MNTRELSTMMMVKGSKTIYRMKWLWSSSNVSKNLKKSCFSEFFSMMKKYDMVERREKRRSQKKEHFMARVFNFLIHHLLYNTKQPPHSSQSSLYLFYINVRMKWKREYKEFFFNFFFIVIIQLFFFSIFISLILFHSITCSRRQKWTLATWIISIKLIQLI
jgi:hypothetical protein